MKNKNGLLAVLFALVIAGLIAGMMYIDSLGEEENAHAVRPRDAADR